MVGGNAAGVGCGGIAGRERGDPAADEGADGHSTVGGLRWGGSVVGAYTEISPTDN